MIPNDSNPPSRLANSLAVAFAIFFPTVVTLAYFVGVADQAAGVQQSVYSVLKIIQFGFPVFWVLAIQRKKIWPTEWTTNGIGTGILFGAAILSVTLLLFHFVLLPGGVFDGPSKIIREKVASFGFTGVWQYAGLGIFYSLCHSLLEEYYWRWFVFGQLRNLVPKWSAIIISALGFALHHVFVLATFFGWMHWATWFFSFSIVIGGIAWAWLYDRSKSLLGPWFSHALIDAGIFIIGYYLVSDMLR